jgi:hypothetical protein
MDENTLEAREQKVTFEWILKKYPEIISTVLQLPNDTVL